MAISTRRKESGAGSNSFTLARLRVPTSEMDVTERFAAIHAAADAVRSSAAGGINLGSLAALAAALPTSLIVRLARQQSGTIDFATSNLRAAPFPLTSPAPASWATSRSARWPGWPSTSRC